MNDLSDHANFQNMFLSLLGSCQQLSLGEGGFRFVHLVKRVVKMLIYLLQIL